MPHTLLFVDDEEPLLRTMREFFELRGFEVDCATELEEALALVEHRRYSAVVCDICLRGHRDTEGLEVISHLRSFCPETRIIILTSSPRQEVREQAATNAVDDFLTKPQPLPYLASLIEEMLVEKDTATHADAS